MCVSVSGMRSLSTATSFRSSSDKAAIVDYDGKNNNYPSLILQGHGLSKSGIEGLRPLPEKANDPSPYSILQGYFTKPTSFYGIPIDSSDEDKLTLSDASSIGTVHSITSIESFQSVKTLGNTTTGRSSVYSWGSEDEFDRQATAEVSNIFDDIDLCLFANNKKNNVDDGPLKEECYEWKMSFQYLRVKGTQVAPDMEGGTQLIPISENFKVDSFEEVTTLEDFIPEDGIDNLSISGNKVDVNTMKTSESIDLLHVQEEVFAEHGQIEEYFAFDDLKIETSRECRDVANKRRAMPPVTPHSFAKEMALNECFDRVWSQIVMILSDLLKLYIKEFKICKGGRNAYGAAISQLVPENDPFRLSQQLHSEMKIKPGDFTDLKDVMKIRSVSLNQRASIVNMNTFRGDDDNQSRLDTSNSLLVQKQFGKPTNLSTRMMSAKTHKRTMRLQPLQLPRTAGHIECNLGEVRGTSLTNANAGSRQQLWVTRNGTLPPLERHFQTDEFTDKSPKRHSRALSAANPMKHSSQRERTSFSFLDSRPNTNQSYRSDVKTPNQYQLPPSRSRDLPLKHHSQTINENSFLQISSNQEIDGLVLWGHGPPLISQQQKHAKSFSNNSNSR